ncbi:MAG: hypothetical protein ACREX9_01735 [Gammaproteobacteria bacterium]
MIPYEIRQAIVARKAQDRTLGDISRLVRVSRNTVRRALRQPHARIRQDSPEHEALVERLPELYRRSPRQRRAHPGNLQSRTGHRNPL